MTAEERFFEVNGYCLAAKEWNKGAQLKVIALHGWLDNAASFDRLASLLEHCHIIALDSPGHGNSDHKPPQASYNIWDDLLDILAVADAMQWPQFHLLAHSRGGMMASILAGSMPKSVSSLVLLDALLPYPADIEDTATQLNRYLRAQRKALLSKLPVYASVEDALQARRKSADKYLPLTEREILPIIERALKPVEGGYSWKSDPRLNTASVMKMTAEHNRVIAEAITSPHLVIMAKRGVGASGTYRESLQALNKPNIQYIDGTHHCHLGEQAEEIAAMIRDFHGSLQNKG